MLRNPWLVAAWPGMASVGMLAVRAVTGPSREAVLEVDPGAWFDGAGVSVHRGIARVPRVARTVFHAVPAATEGQPDLLTLLATEQPRTRLREFADAVLEAALALGATRVVTFAAMAAATEPSGPSRVHAAASSLRGLRDAIASGAIALEEGEISGLNGALVAAAARRGLEGLCLLGEFPFFASAVPNPKAAAAVVRVFGRLAGRTFDVASLDEQAEVVDRRLAQFLEALPKPGEEAESPGGSEGPHGASEAPERAVSEHAGPSPDDVARIESLFAQAAADRGKALELKAELDRLGLFRRYQDRFLDLFRRAE